jgi:hypothetical protein
MLCFCLGIVTYGSRLARTMRRMQAISGSSARNVHSVAKKPARGTGLAGRIQLAAGAIGFCFLGMGVTWVLSMHVTGQDAVVANDLVFRVFDVAVSTDTKKP